MRSRIIRPSPRTTWSTNQSPERKGGLEEHADAAIQLAWYEKARGTARDLPAFYELLIGAVRSADATTPIMLDAGFYAAADGFDVLARGA